MASQQLRISDHAIINAIHRRLPESALFLYAAALIYVSLVPFDFSRTANFSAGARYVGRLQLNALNLPDIFANLAVYMPLGALCFMALRAAGRRATTALVASVILSAGISLGVEHAQVFTRSRVAAWPDFACNVLGALVGAVVTATWFGRFLGAINRGREAARRNWWSAVSKGAVCVAVLAFLRPFDVAVDLPRTVLRAMPPDIHPLAGWDRIPHQVEAQAREGRLDTALALERYRFEYALERVSEVATYAGLTILLAFGGFGPGARGRRSSLYVRTAMVIVFVGALVTTIRVGLASHGFDAAHFYCALAGWLVGTMAAELMVLRHREAAGADGPPSSFDHLPPIIVCLSIVAGLALAVLHELAPMDFGTSSGGISLSNTRLNWVPFKSHFLSRPNDAFYDLSGEFLLYATLGLCTSHLLCRLLTARWRLQAALSVCLVAGAACVFEALHLTMASRHADVTNIVVAAFAAACASILMQWMVDYRQHLNAGQPDDPLTRLLTEGPGYRPLPTPSPRGSRRSDASPTDRAESRSRD